MTAREWAAAHTERGECPAHDLAVAYVTFFRAWELPGALGWGISALAKAGLLSDDRETGLVKPK